MDEMMDYLEGDIRKQFTERIKEVFEEKE
jgi:hypothetical protein